MAYFGRPFLDQRNIRNQSGARMLVLAALLLLALPLLLTFAKFVAEVAVSSHQLQRLTADNLLGLFAFLNFGVLLQTAQQFQLLRQKNARLLYPVGRHAFNGPHAVLQLREQGFTRLNGPLDVLFANL